MAIKVQGSTVIYDDRVFNVKTGNTASRPSGPEEGTFWYNNQLGLAERYKTSSGWESFSSSSDNINELVYPNVYTVTDSSFVKLDGSTLLQSSYPNSFSKFGLIANSPTNSWVSRTTNILNRDNPVLAYGNGLFLTAEGNNNATSTDAVNWTAGTAAPANIESIRYFESSSNEKYLRVGATGSIGSSTNGIDWTVRTSGTITRINDIAFGNGTYVYGALGGVIGYSTNAINWTVGSSGANDNIDTLVYGKGVFVAGGANMTIRISTNGINWLTTARENTAGSIAVVFYSDADGIFFWGSTNGRLATSTDAITWTPRTVLPTLNQNVLNITYGSGIYLVGQSNGVVAYSTNGLSWTNVEEGSKTAIGTVNVEGLTYGGGIFVAGGTDMLATWTPYTYNHLTEFAVPEMFLPVEIGASYFNVPLYSKE